MKEFEHNIGLNRSSIIYRRCVRNLEKIKLNLLKYLK